MARIRTIKPEFFRHEGLQDLERANPGACVMLVFAGLWGHCDKGGVFEWKPRTLKLDILPFLDFDMGSTLALLEQAGLVTRYAAAGKEYGAIPTFAEHQRIGGKEAEAPVKHPRTDGEAPGKQLGLQEGKGREKEGNGEAQALVPGLDEAAWNRWLDYRVQIRKPLKQVSMPAAQRELAAFGSTQAAVVEQSIASGWQGLFALKDAKNPTSRASPVDIRTSAIERIKQHAANIQCPLVPRETEPAEAYETRVKSWEREHCKPALGQPKFASVAALAAAKTVTQ